LFDIPVTGWIHPLRGGANWCNRIALREIFDGREDDKVGSTLRFRPRRFPYSDLIIDGHSGYISLQAFHWLSKHKVPVFIMDFDGTVISSILPPMPVKADLRAAQILAANDLKKFTIARALRT
jgi:hypothetical protein